MVEYPFVFDHAGARYMLYSGEWIRKNRIRVGRSRSMKRQLKRDEIRLNRDHGPVSHPRTRENAKFASRGLLLCMGSFYVFLVRPCGAAPGAPDRWRFTLTENRFNSIPSCLRLGGRWAKLPVSES